MTTPNNGSSPYNGGFDETKLLNEFGAASASGSASSSASGSSTGAAFGSRFDASNFDPRKVDWNGVRDKAGTGLNRFLKANLHRSRDDKYVAGVLGGIAETYGIDSTLVRLLFLASFLLPGPQAILYFIMWFVMPRGY